MRCCPCRGRSSEGWGRFHAVQGCVVPRADPAPDAHCCRSNIDAARERAVTRIRT
jgi:hypothetical protein